MSLTLFIQAGRVGVQADLFNMYYTLIGSNTKYNAVDSNGNAINPVTSTQLLTGFYIVVPDNVAYVYACNYGGPLDGRCYVSNYLG